MTTDIKHASEGTSTESSDCTPWSYEYSPYRTGDGTEVPAFEIRDAQGNKICDTNENLPVEEQECHAQLITASPALLEAAETALTRFAWVIDLVNKAVGHMNIDDIPQEAIELLDEVTSSEYFKDDIESVQLAIAEAKGLAA